MKVERTDTLGLNIMATIEIGTNPDARTQERQALAALDDLIQFASDLGEHEMSAKFHALYLEMETKCKHLGERVNLVEYMNHLRLVK